MTNHYFSFRPLLLFPKRLCVPNRLRKSVERSKSFLCFGFFQDTRTSKNPTAHIIIYVLRLFPARLVYAKPHRYWAYCTRYESVIIVRGLINPATRLWPTNMPLVIECISILVRSMAQGNTWVGVVASSTRWSASLIFEIDFMQWPLLSSQDRNGMIVLLAG